MGGGKFSYIFVYGGVVKRFSCVRIIRDLQGIFAGRQGENLYHFSHTGSKRSKICISDSKMVGVVGIVQRGSLVCRGMGGGRFREFFIMYDVHG